MNVNDLAGIEAAIYGNVDNDDDLEAELLALEAAERGQKVRAKGKGLATPSASASNVRAGQTRPTGGAPARSGGVNFAEIHKLARAISEEVAISDDDDDAIEDDPDLLAELADLSEGSDDDDLTLSSTHQTTPPPPQASKNNLAAPIMQQRAASSPSLSLVGLLEERLQTYQKAEVSAKTAGDGAKARRYGRGVKTLEEQLKAAKSGRPVNEEEIPPPVGVAVKPPQADDAIPISHAQLPSVVTPPQPSVAVPPLPPPRVAPPPPRVAPTLPSLQQSVNAIQGFPPLPGSPEPPPSKPLSTKVIDGTRVMLETRRDEYKHAALLAKQRGDTTSALSYYKICKQMDALLVAYANGTADLSHVPPSPGQFASAEGHHQSSPPKVSDEPPLPEMEGRTEAEMFNAPPPPTSVLDALVQRMEKYKQSAEQAQAAGDTSKMRRMDRIRKQYEDAIKAYKAGKPVDFEELPTPPGFAPIPLPSKQGTPKQPSAGPSSASPKPAVTATPASHHTSTGGEGPTPPKMSRQEQQLQFLLQRQLQFKQAALAAKKAGDTQRAMDFLKQAKGFDQMIEASRNGLRVDISQTPQPPQLKASAVSSKGAVVAGSDSSFAKGTAMDNRDIYETLDKDLVRQFQLCAQCSEYFTRMGDVTKAAMYDKLGSDCKRDLVALRNGAKHNSPVPRFHYDVRVVPDLNCNPDLGDGDLELSIVRAMQVKLPTGFEPKDLYTFVAYTFPFPETPQTGKTEIVKGTNCPVFNFSTKLEINRKSRGLLRVVKSKGVKFELFHKTGFMRSDKSLGSIEVKLAALETSCQIHDSFDLMEGRKPCGGKLEVKIRIREALGQQSQATERREKWLVIDQFVRTK